MFDACAHLRRPSKRLAEKARKQFSILILGHRKPALPPGLLTVLSSATSCTALGHDIFIVAAIGDLFQSDACDFKQL
jgi:hypothetical protein